MIEASTVMLTASLAQSAGRLNSPNPPQPTTSPDTYQVRAARKAYSRSNHGHRIVSKYIFHFCPGDLAGAASLMKEVDSIM